MTNEAITQKISDIRAKLAALRIQTQHKMCSGLEVMNSPLKIGEVETWEKSYRVRLPEEYRRFLLEVGNGDDSLFALEETTLKMYLAEPHRHERLKSVHQPFPLTEAWVWEGVETMETEAELESRHERAEQGSIFISDDGCGMYWRLIVTGEERGKMWMFCGEGIAPPEPRLDFLSWYQKYVLDNEEIW